MQQTDEQRRASEQRHLAQELRAARRQALARDADVVAAEVLSDIGILDDAPGAAPDENARSGALGRLSALADRAPEIRKIAVSLLQAVIVIVTPSSCASQVISSGKSTKAMCAVLSGLNKA